MGGVAAKLPIVARVVKIIHFFDSCITLTRVAEAGLYVRTDVVQR